MNRPDRLLLNGDEAVAHAAMDNGVLLGAGYPGTPSTEILEVFGQLGGKAQWSPNEKVAVEVALGAAFGNGRAMATMKHVGLNVASDPLFTATHTGVSGALVLVVADDPGMASSQNEQDSRRYAVAAGAPMLEPSDSQEAYDFMARAIEISERWKIPVLLRLTTRVSHSKTIVKLAAAPAHASAPHFEHDMQARVMIPANARPAHRRLRKKLAEIAEWGETCDLNTVSGGESDLGIIANGISVLHAGEAAPQARILKLGMTYPLPFAKIRKFAGGVKRCMVIEEGDPIIVEACRAEGIAVEGKQEMYRFGELNVERVRRILAGDVSPEAAPPRGKPPELCPGCPHRSVFETLKKLDCIVAGDIGCYTLGVLPPFQAMDTCVCMGASIGVGLGLRHVLPENQAKRVVSVIGDSTFVHSGITGLVEMIYNPPPTGHVILILDNGTTAMTGLQDHPGTGQTLCGDSTGQVVFEDLARALKVPEVHVVDAQKDRNSFEDLLKKCLDGGKLCLIIARKPCILSSKKIREAAASATDDAARKV
ncbi:MAG: thiamine pyrophosphate-binding protein [Verrucomicrobia bacterium]|nr:thiamine pyrophosphate-binding protein [Verrucomicrobiota bacterium]